MNHLDLFSGIGGFALAARWAGFNTIAFCEKDVFCQKVLRKNWPDVPIFDDVKTFDHSTSCRHHVDIMTAGFPCQPFSVAGKQKGKDDDRYLWPEVIRLVRLCNPSWLILENVPGIIPMLDPILEDLEKESYDWRAFLIPASAVHAPHKRERIWIVANRHSERCDDRGDNRQERHIQADIEQYLKTLQSEWSQFQPVSWTNFNAQDWLGFTPDPNSVSSDKRTENNETKSERSEWSKPSSEAIPHSTEFSWEESKPPIPGVDDGLSNGLDRNKALGNAIVPQIAYLLMMMIKEVDAHIRDRT